MGLQTKHNNHFSSFESWASGLDWGEEETLEQQRVRILSEVLPHILEWQKHFERSKEVTSVNKQLTLF